MADVITRLRVESTEYDSKIKRAAQGLLQMEQACRRVGGTLAILEKDELEFVKGLGKMETVSKDARGQLNELTKAFTDLSLQYKRLTDEEKQGDFGKALASSLGELRTRIHDTKGQLSEINGEINGGGGLTGALDQLAGKFGLNIQQLAGWGAALGAAKVALDVSRDAFFQSESNIDEWGRTVKGAEGAYNTFLDTINSGNWSEFFSNMSTAVQGARDLYDALDRLGSIKSNNAAAIAIIQQQIAQLRLAKQQGENVDEQIKAATAKLAELQGQSVSAGKSAGTLSIGNIIRSAYDTHGTGSKISDRNINNVVNELLQDGQNAFDKYAKVYQRLEEKASDTRKVTVGTSITGASISATERYTNLDKLTEEERKQYTLSKAITEAETRIQKGISIYAQAVSEGTANAREEFKGNRYALSGSGGGKGGGGSTTTVAKDLNPMQQAQKEISALTEEALTADEARRKVIREEIADLQKQVEEYKKIQDYVTGNGAAAQGSLPQLTQQIKDLQQAQSQSLDTREWVEYQKQIDVTTTKIDILKGKWKDGQVAAFSIDVNNTEAYDLLKNLEGVNIDEETITVTANTAEAYNKVQELIGGIDGTSVSFEVKPDITYTDANMQAFLSDLKKQVQQAEIGTDFYNSLTSKIADATALQNLIKVAIENGIDPSNFNAGALWETLLSADGISDEQLQEVVDYINQFMGEHPIKLNVDTGSVSSDGKGNTKSEGNETVVSVSSKMASGISSISSSIERLGVTLPEGLNAVITGIQTISSILSGISAIVSAIEVMTTVSSLPFFARGGIAHAANGLFVPGNSYSGDNVPALLNSGELILNKAAQGNLASQLQEGNGGKVSSTPYVSGEQIYLGLTNYLIRSGRGELLTARG